MAREERERRYIADYLLHFYPRGGWTKNVPLGPIPADIVARFGLAAGAKLYQPTRLRIDAILALPDAYWLIEAKMLNPRDAIGDLTTYMALVKSTPDLPGYDGQPIKARLVIPWSLDWIDDMAKSHGFDVQVYLPPWVEDYVRERQHYFTREYRVQRDDKMRARRILGLE